ncbi:MAG: ABC transporter ATP-binding protein [Spirochaetales bacterium]|nr:ABC transporter ATP-binding protein [Spirochaetales bacterium]
MIRIEHLVRKFGSFTAVDDISFSVGKGEVFGFLGANGAGKTTTIRMMCGLLRPTAGDIFIDGLSVKSDPEKVKRHIGYMSQKFSLYADLTPEMNIGFFGAVYGVSRKKIAESKEQARRDLGAFAFSRPSGELPLGYKQRLGLSCALLHSPPVIFLDEPTSGVDPGGRREFWEEIYNISSKGTTVLITTHFMDEAEYCDRIGIMSFGRLICLDAPSVIKREYGADTLQQSFIRAIEKDMAKAGAAEVKE